MQPPVDHVLVRTTKPKAAAAVRIGAGLGQQKRVELAGLLQVCFARVEPWLQARKYVSAVASGLARRNGWTIAEQAGDRSPDKTQRLRNRAVWGTWGAMGVAPRAAVAGLEAAAGGGGGGSGRPGGGGTGWGSGPPLPWSGAGGGGGGPARGPPGRGERTPAAGRSAPPGRAPRASAGMPGRGWTPPPRRITCWSAAPRRPASWPSHTASSRKPSARRWPRLPPPSRCACQSEKI